MLRCTGRDIQTSRACGDSHLFPLPALIAKLETNDASTSLQCVMASSVVKLTHDPQTPTTAPDGLNVH